MPYTDYKPGAESSGRFRAVKPENYKTIDDKLIIIDDLEVKDSIWRIGENFFRDHYSAYTGDVKNDLNEVNTHLLLLQAQGEESARVRALKALRLTLQTEYIINDLSNDKKRQSIAANDGLYKKYEKKLTQAREHLDKKLMSLKTEFGVYLDELTIYDPNIRRNIYNYSKGRLNRDFVAEYLDNPKLNPELKHHIRKCIYFIDAIKSYKKLKSRLSDTILDILSARVNSKRIS